VKAKTTPVVTQAVMKATTDASTAGKPAPSPDALKAITGKAKGPIEEKEAAIVQKWQEVGGLLGRILLAVGVLYISSRRALLRLFAVPALLFIPALFWWIGQNMGTAGTIGALKWGVFLAGVLLVGQFSFWGNYIPRVFPVHLRGTGESFAANIGGRVLGTSMAWLFFTFSDATPPNPSKMAYTAATIAAVMALLTLVIIPFMTEPKAEDAE